MSEFYRRREQNDQLRLVNVNHACQQVIELTSPVWRDISQGRGSVIHVEPKFESSLPELFCNESELREALTNVVLNAVDALPRGGIIQLCTRAVTNVAGKDRKTSHIAIDVRDDGIGMDDKTRQRCLEPFFSTKRARG